MYIISAVTTALRRKAGMEDDGLSAKVALLLMNPEESLKRHGKALENRRLLPGNRTASVAEYVPKLLAEQAFGCRLDLLGTEPMLTVTFHCPVEPDYTNGVWDEKERAIVWKRVIGDEEGSDRRLPTGLYAMWTAPDEEAQQRLLPPGRLLEKDELTRYCLWRATLSAEQAKLYDAHLDAVAKAADRQAAWDRFFEAHGEEPPFRRAPRPARQAARHPADDGCGDGRRVTARRALPLLPAGRRWPEGPVEGAGRSRPALDPRHGCHGLKSRAARRRTASRLLKPWHPA